MAKSQSRTNGAGAVKLREKKLSKGGTSLYLDTYHEGKRSYEFLGLYTTGDKKADALVWDRARAIQRKRLSELDALTHGLLPGEARQASFLDYYHQLVLQKKHVTYRYTHKRLAEFAGERLTFSQLTPSFVESFRDHLADRYHPNTAFLYYRRFRTGLARAVRDGYLQYDPSEKVDGLSYQETQRVYLTIDELRKLEAARCPNPETKRAFLFACYTGLRISDIKALRWENIKEGRIEHRQKKTRRIEAIPLNAMARARLRGNSHALR